MFFGKKKKKIFGFFTADEMAESTKYDAQKVIYDIKTELFKIHQYNMHVTGYGYSGFSNMPDDVKDEVLNYFRKGGYLAYEDEDYGALIVRWDEFARNLSSSETD